MLQKIEYGLGFGIQRRTRCKKIYTFKGVMLPLQCKAVGHCSGHVEVIDIGRSRRDMAASRGRRSIAIRSGPKGQRI